MIETMIKPQSEVLLSHPGSAGYGRNTCPECVDRCGDLIHGHCLGCEVDWDEAAEEELELEADCDLAWADSYAERFVYGRQGE